MSSSTMPYVIGNWKMNLDIEAAMALAGEAAEMANAAVSDVRVGVAVPFPWIPLVASAAVESELLVGCQDVSSRDQGAFTGDVSAAMVAPWCTFAIVGHSERRVLHGETDDVVRAKLEQVLANRLAAVLCVGETQAQRDRGEALPTVERQLTVATVTLDGDALRGILVAYEPVWAIGTGHTPTPADAQEMAAHIRTVLARLAQDAAPEVPILYGGSVNGENAAAFFNEDDIDGGLVGGASLDPESFFQVIQAAVPA
jgi:triosephosphate isomerase